LVTELLRVGLAAEASELLSRRSDRSPDNECARAHAAALEGELGAARTHLRRLTATYHSTGHGAHPKAVRETARAMAERTSGNEARCYRMLARLQDLTPLTEGPCGPAGALRSRRGRVPEGAGGCIGAGLGRCPAGGSVGRAGECRGACECRGGLLAPHVPWPTLSR